jgi:hypothetical protein
LERLNVGLMAVDSEQVSLTQNGVTVTVIKTDKKIVIESSGQEVVNLEILQEKP